jgi:hypothetical protein
MRFTLDLPDQAILDCAHSGPCDEDVNYWAPRINRPEAITAEVLRAELKECGAWDTEELTDDSVNWERLIWLAAGQIKDEQKELEH